jgi:hypothetical protein
LNLSNLQTLCSECNLGKGSEFADDWRAGEGKITAGVPLERDTDAGPLEARPGAGEDRADASLGAAEQAGVATA